MITDSGGIQEETTYLGIPCITVRDNTERPVTVDQGTNTIVGQDRSQIFAVMKDVLNNGGIIDGVAIHAYTREFSVGAISSDEWFPGREFKWHLHFRGYRDLRSSPLRARLGRRRMSEVARTVQ